jgi:hypothetical protein
MNSVESQQKFAWNKLLLLATCFHAGILIALFDPEDGGDMFLRKFGRRSRDYRRYIPQESTLRSY